VFSTVKRTHKKALEIKFFIRTSLFIEKSGYKAAQRWLISGSTRSQNPNYRITKENFLIWQLFEKLWLALQIKHKHLFSCNTSKFPKIAVKFKEKA
jgi:hypothetical protein